MPNKYCLAVKRDFKGTVPADWREQVAAIDGVTMISPINVPRLVIEVRNQQVVDQITAKVGAFCHVEPEILHTIGGGNPASVGFNR